MTSRRAVLLLPGSDGPRYLLGPFRFTTDQAAPLTSPYTEGGAVGSLTLVQTDGELSTSGGKLVFPAQATVTAGDLGFYSPTGLSRVAGRALLATARFSTIAAGRFGWSTTASAFATGASREAGFEINTAQRIREAGLELAVPGDAVATATDYAYAVILRTAGAFYVRDGKLLWVSDAGSTATLYPAFGNDSAVGSFDNIRGTDLGGAFASDFGLATQRLAGARSAGDTFSHTADALVEWVVSDITAGNTVAIRSQDSNNEWRVAVAADGTLNLNEIVAGGATQRGTAAAVVANGHRIVVIADGTTIRGYSNNSLRWTYSSASNFQTATAGRISTMGGLISDVVAWPRSVSLPSV